MIEVTIIIPTYNRVNLLEKALKSLFNQKFPPDRYEIIVCDDGSTDGTENMVKGLIQISPCNLRYFKQENQGPAAARNLGISQARGDIIGFTDDDCIASDTWISNAISYFKDPDITGVQGATFPIEKISFKKKIFNYAKTIRVTGLDNTYPTCNIFYRKNAIIKVGGFDVKFRSSFLEDADLAYKLINKKYKIIFGEDVIIYHPVNYIPLIKYLKTLKKIEYIGLLVKNNPTYRENFTLGFIYRKEHIYPLFLILSIILYIFSRELFNISFLMFIASYLWGRVLIDKNFKTYPIRIIGFLRYLLLDSIGLYYTLRGSLKYKCFII